jgi:hypothetical protein
MGDVVAAHHYSARALVPEDQRAPPVETVEIGVTHAARSDFDQHFVDLRRVHLKSLECKMTPAVGHDRFRFHRRSTAR